jgi:riboflavin biosynthesis pyrimidine reductase
MNKLIRLFPIPVSEVKLNGVYLAQDLQSFTIKSAKPFVYANFVVSIDGRIAIPRKDGSGLTVPKQIANERDWRLFQELAAQADIIISSGRYLREWAEGRAQEILQVDDPRYADLRTWRNERGLSPQPDLAIISASLSFPIPDVLTEGGRRFFVFTIDGHAPDRLKEIESKGGEVYPVGRETVNSRLMIEKMDELGYRSIYSAAGPKIHHMLLVGGVLNRLYLTYANRILGGQPFASILEGEILTPPVGLHINSIYYDSEGLDGLGQLFVTYDLE